MSSAFFLRVESAERCFLQTVVAVTYGEHWVSATNTWSHLLDLLSPEWDCLSNKAGHRRSVRVCVNVQYVFVHVCQMPWSVRASGIKVGGLPALSGMNRGWILSRNGRGSEQTDLREGRPAVAHLADVYFLVVFFPKVKALLLAREQHKPKSEVQATYSRRGGGSVSNLI